MSNLSINHIYKAKGLLRKFCDSPPRNTESSPKRVFAKIREVGLSPSLTWLTIAMAQASTKPSLPQQSKNPPTKQRAKPKKFYILSVTLWVHLLIILETIAWRSTIWPSIMLLVIEVGSPRASNKISLCLGSQGTAMDFLPESLPRIAENFFNCRAKFSSFKPEYTIFSILEL